MQEAEGQRRLTAIVSVDLAGFSRRAEADEPGALQDVGKLAVRVEAAARDHGGRVFSTAGDGFMLEFPTVSGALEAADALAATGDVRVGVHLGEVSVAAGGDLLGHGVNVAARLQALAQPGSVVVSSDVRRAVRGPIADRFQPRGRVRLDKMKEASPVFVLAPATGKAPRLRRRAPAPVVAAIVAAAGLAAAIGAGLALWSRSQAPPAPTAARIAVLPLQALGDRPESKAFAEGVADQIATSLSANNIQVISSVDAAALRGPDRERQARSLGAALVLDGAVRDLGDGVDIRVHLDDPAQHTVLWTTEVKGPRAQAAQMQAHTAKLVVNTLGCSSRALTPVHGLRAPELLSRYLRACDIFANAGYTPQKVYELFDALREVTTKAPDFAPAHSDLAKFSGYFIATMPPGDAPGLRAQGLAEAKAALALDPKSPDARLAQEFLLPPTAWGDREALLRKAVADAPDWPHTNGFLGMMLVESGRTQEGMPYFHKAAAADLNIDWKPVTALMLVCQTGDNSALEALREELAVEGDNASARPFLLGALICAGEYKEARDVMRAGYAKGSAGVVARARLETTDAYLTAMITRAPKDRAEARRLLLQAPGGTNSRTLFAIEDLAELGFPDDAFALADHFEPGGPNSGAQITGLFDKSSPLHRDPRFMRLAQRWKLLDYWRARGAWPDFCAEPGLPYDCKAEAAKLR